MTIGAYLDGTTTDAKFGLGDCFKDEDGRSFVYVQAGGAITQYDWVSIDENYAALAGTKGAADDGHMVGFAQVAFANDDYGWVLTQGANVTARVAASCAADVALYTTGTGGILDDETTSQTKIEGVVAVAANTTTSVANVEVLLTFPRSAGF